jgi:hypothetical protein
MLIDFSRIDNETFKLAHLQAEVSHADLITATNEMLDCMGEIIQSARDEYVTFVPVDPHAHDAAAGSDSEVNLAWTLGHVVVHATASGEETASIGASLARGVAVTWRDRYEVPWETLHSAQQLHHRLEESRRMRLAMLQSWPDQPHLEVLFTKVARWGDLNAIGYTLLGLKHDHDHLDQLAEIMRQGRELFG